MNDTLHRISQLKWLFLISQIGLILYCFIVMPDNLITMLGILIYVSGIQLGLESLSNISRMTEKEIARFRLPGHANLQVKILLVSISVLAVISMFFISLKFIFESRKIFDELFSLGLNCWALILGLLCLVKFINDKKTYVDSLKEEL